MHGDAIAKALWQITPGYACPIAEDDGIDEQAIIGGRPADVAFAAGQEILDPVPLIVAQGMAMHPSASKLPTTHESEKHRFGNPATDDGATDKVRLFAVRGSTDSHQLTTGPSPD